MRGDSFSSPSTAFLVRMTFWSLAFGFSINVFATLSNYAIQSLWPEDNVTMLSRINGLNSFTHIIVVFVMVFNDRLVLRRGRRKTFLLIGSAVTVVAYCLIATSKSKWVFVLCYYLIEIFGHVCFSCTNAIPVEHLSSTDNGRSGGLSTALLCAGSLCGFTLIYFRLSEWGVQLFFALDAIVVAICCFVPIFSVDEPAAKPVTKSRLSVFNRSFLLLVLGRVLGAVCLGVQLFWSLMFRDTIYIQLPFIKAGAKGTEMFSLCGIIALVVGIIESVILGSLASRFKIKTLPVTGAIIQAIAFIILSVVPLQLCYILPVIVFFIIGNTALNAGELRLLHATLTKGAPVAQPIAMFHSISLGVMFGSSFLYGAVLNRFVSARSIDAFGVESVRYSEIGYRLCNFIAACFGLLMAYTWGSFDPRGHLKKDLKFSGDVSELS